MIGANALVGETLRGRLEGDEFLEEKGREKKFPFHRSHALAEQLAASAKRLYRLLAARGEGASTLDWLAISEAWREDVADVRRRDAIRTYRTAADTPPETLILSRKPYRILGAEGSLDVLRRAAEAARPLARGQLMALGEAVDAGRWQADWTVRLLAPEQTDHLGPVVQSGPDGKTIWRDHQDRQYSTALLDFLELFELE